MRTAAALLLVVFAGVAHADDASALFKRGVEALRAQDYAAAATAFQQSYALSPKAATMCNLALTYDRWPGHVADAMESYRKCAEDDASGRFRDHALERARQLRAELAATPAPPSPPPVEHKPEPNPEPPPLAAPSPPPKLEPTPPVAVNTPTPAPVAVVEAPPPPPRTRPFFRDPAACVLASVGAAGIISGAVLVAVGKLDDNQVATTVDLGQKATLYDRAGTLQPAGYVALGVGGALVLAGVIEWAAHGRHVRR